VAVNPNDRAKSKTASLNPAQKRSRHSGNIAAAEAVNPTERKIQKALQVGVIPYAMGVDNSAIRNLEATLPKGYVDSIAPAAGGGWRLSGQASGIDCLIQPALRQVLINGVTDEKMATDTTIKILEAIRETLPTPHYLALTIGQTFHLPVGGNANEADALIEQKLLSRDRDPLRKAAYVVGLRYYFAEIYQSTITVDPLLADRKFLFLQYLSTKPGVFAAGALREAVDDLRGTNVDLLDSIIAYLFRN
jgi:hypothetical protein